ncbi:MAG: aldo/keto reductase [Clostridia bacterium]|nr:aldo/keto reductase [Clostridia bacterium]
MEQRVLGDSGIAVSPLGLGGWAIGGPFTLEGHQDGWGSVDDAESIRAIHRAVELGVTLFDTADAYGTGHSEEVLGKALKDVRRNVVIATKGGFTYDRDKRALIGQDWSPAYIRRALEASLLRLDTDYVDLYQLHTGYIPDEAVEPVFDEMEQLRREGKLRAYGWSTYTREKVELFAAKTRGSVIQTKANLFSYDAEAVAACEAHGFACLNNSPLAMGFLSGKFSQTTRFDPDDVRASAFDWTEYFEDGKPKPEFLGRMARVRDALTSGGRTAAQGALAWLWAKSDANIPIPGFKTLAQAEENARAMAFGPLNAAQMRQIDEALGA